MTNLSRFYIVFDVKVYFVVKGPLEVSYENCKKMTGSWKV